MFSTSSNCLNSNYCVQQFCVFLKLPQSLFLDGKSEVLNKISTTDIFRFTPGVEFLFSLYCYFHVSHIPYMSMAMSCVNLKVAYPPLISPECHPHETSQVQQILPRIRAKEEGCIPAKIPKLFNTEYQTDLFLRVLGYQPLEAIGMVASHWKD